MRTSADVATHHSAAKSFSQNHCPLLVSTTAALTELTPLTTSSLCLRTWACPTATFSARCVRISDASDTTLLATVSSSPRTRMRSKRYVPASTCSSVEILMLILPNRSKTKTCGTQASSIPSYTPTNTSSAASCSRTSASRAMAIWVLMGLVKDRIEPKVT